MKLNNKGITLVELIVSIALISIVIMFLFRLLVDVRYSENNTDYNRENQQTRAIIIKTVETDFLERKLIGLDDSSSTENTFEVKFSYADGTTGILRAVSDSVTYTNSAGTEKWRIEKETESTQLNIRCVSYQTSLFKTSDGEFFYVSFTIPVSVNQKKKNYIDDLEFFYLGEKKDLNPNAFPNSSSLGKYNTNQCG